MVEKKKTEVEKPHVHNWILGLFHYAVYGQDPHYSIWICECGAMKKVINQ